MAARTRRVEGVREPAPSGVRPPDAERLISDVETLKALSDPLRLRILEPMVTRPDGAWTVKEMAGALEVPQTRLYHHVELLVERDLIRAAEQRVVSGIIETRYQVSALSFRLDQALVHGAGPGQTAARDVITTIFDETRRDIERILAIPAAPARWPARPNQPRPEPGPPHAGPGRGAPRAAPDPRRGIRQRVRGAGRDHVPPARRDVQRPAQEEASHD